MPRTASLPIFLDPGAGGSLQHQIYQSIRRSIIDGHAARAQRTHVAGVALIGVGDACRAAHERDAPPAVHADQVLDRVTHPGRVIHTDVRYARALRDQRAHRQRAEGIDELALAAKQALAAGAMASKLPSSAWE